MTRNTRTALLDVAETAARARGYDAFSFADLAQAVDIRKASVHHHFPTKAALSEALIARYHDRIAARLDRLETSTVRASDRLAGFLTIYREALDSGQSLCLCVSFSASQSSLPEAVATRMMAYRNMVSVWLETVFVLGLQDGTIALPGNPAFEAPALLALVEGAQLAARTALSPDPFDKATAQFRYRLL